MFKTQQTAPLFEQNRPPSLRKMPKRRHASRHIHNEKITENKEFLTGYNYESWHYRYVGVDVATQIKNEDITFDEYYAYYVEG